MRTISIISILLFSSIFGKAQCDEGNYCKDLQSDFIFNTQSVYGELSPGDTKTIKTVCYGNKRYRIFVCSEKQNIPFKIIKEERKSRRKLVSIKNDTIKELKMNEYGEVEYPEKVLNTKIMRDTTWAYERYIEKHTIFDSQKSTEGKAYWDQILDKTLSITIEVKMPEGDAEQTECIAVMIGNKSLANKNFYSQGGSSSSRPYRR